MGSIKTQDYKTKTTRRPAKKKVVPWQKRPWWVTTHIGLAIATALIFIAGWLFDTQALVQLAWIGGRSGIGWLLHHRLVSLLTVGSIGAIAWGGFQSRPVPVKLKRQSDKPKPSGSVRDPSRSARPTQVRRSVGSRRPTATPRL
jgi:hypothetical protein